MINEVLKFIDDIYKAQEEVAKRLNDNYENFWCIYESHDYSERGLNHVDKDFLLEVMNEEGFAKSSYNYDLNEPLLYTTPVHVNGGQYKYTAVILFPIWTPYPRRDYSREAYTETLEKSYLTKPLYRKDNIEVGLTIENELKEPTDTCWGYRFGAARYYIIKDGEKTITSSRSKIRKIFNGHDIDTTENIRISTKGTFEILEHNKIFQGKNGAVFQVDLFNLNNIEDSDEYFIGYEDALYEMYEDMVDDDTLISMIGGIEEIVKRYLEGGSFDKHSFLRWNYSIEDLLGLSEDLDKPYVEFSSLDADVYDLSNLRIWKIL